MNRTTIALIMKFIATFVAAWIAFGFMLGNPISSIFILTIAGTVLNYLLGDLVILRAFGNIIASISDGILSIIIAYAYSIMSPDFNVNWTTLIIFGVIIAVAEAIFHTYLKRDEKVAPNP
jgi:hypothetical protein